MRMLPRFWTFLRSRTKEQWVFGVGVAAAISYVMLYVAYFQFFTLFGLRPADVGLTKLRLLEESVIALLLLPLTRLFVDFLRAAQILIGVLVVTVGLGVFLRWPRATFALRIVDYQGTALLALLAGYGMYGYLLMVKEATQLGNDVFFKGKIVIAWQTNMVRPDGFEAPSNAKPWLAVPNIDIQALPVTLVRQPDPQVKFTEGCTLHLGQSASHVVLFDVRRETVIRVPLLGSIVSTHPGQGYNTQFLPDACSSDDGIEAPAPNIKKDS